MASHVMMASVLATDGTVEREGFLKLSLPYYPLEAAELAKLAFAQALAALLTMDPKKPWSWHITIEIEEFSTPRPTEEEFKLWLANQLGTSTMQWTTFPLASLCPLPPDIFESGPSSP